MNIYLILMIKIVRAIQLIAKIMKILKLDFQVIKKKKNKIIAIGRLSKYIIYTHYLNM